MKNSMPDEPRKLSSIGVSSSELSEFLDQLALLYSSDVYGNPSLAYSLKELSRAVKREEYRHPLNDRKRESRLTEMPPDLIERLRSLDGSAVKKYISDESKTKTELIELASVRFSMPTSQLKRQRIDEVRATVMSALLHESSIEILSDEAGKDGANRTT